MSRIRADQITNNSASGPPTATNGLVVNNGLNVVGVATATTFVGNVTGTTSNASGATGDFSIADKIVHTGDTDTAIRFPAADTFTVETAGTEQMRIASDGNVLLNTTTNNGANLVVNQAGANSPAASGNMDSGFFLGMEGTGSSALNMGADGTNVWYNAAYANNSGVARGHAFYTGATERLRIGSSGQLGLGGANYGTSGQVLTSNGSGSAPTWQDGGGAWTLISTISPSNAATASFTSGIDSTYDTYVIVGSGIKPTGSSNYTLNMRISTDGGSSYISSNTYRAILGNSTTTSANIDGVSNTLQVTGNTEGVSGDSNASAGFELWLQNLGSSSLYKTGYGESSSVFLNTGVANIQYRHYGWANSTTSAVNAIQFYFSGSQNISDGEFRLYGINNS